MIEIPPKFAGRPAVNSERCRNLDRCPCRGVHPGDTPREGPPRRTGLPLNEGRGVHPGDTLRTRARSSRFEQRSTKAGAFTPATPFMGGALSPG